MLQILCLMLVWALAVPPAQAAPPLTVEPAQTPAYEQLINDAIREFRERNFAEARSLFSRANELYPNARAIRGIGMAEFEMGNYAESIDQFQLALAHTVLPLEGNLRKDTEELLARSERFVNRYRVEATPILTSVLVNGAVRQLRPGNLLILEVGDHEIEFQAPGFVPERRSLNVKGGEQSILAVSLSPIIPPEPGPAPVPPPPVPTPTEPVHQRRPLRKSPWLWTAVGVVVTGAAVGTALALRKDDGGTATPIAPNPNFTAKGP